MNKKNIIHCKLNNLKDGDTVKIKHYTLYNNGYWQSPMFVDYLFLGLVDGQYHFGNVNDARERFRTEAIMSDCHEFMGKYE